MIYTFYSYKGGVGRTMALANVAELFYQAGLKVLMVDWDLEAPGLERFFPVEAETILDKPGVVDMLLGYKRQMTQDPPDAESEGASLPFEKPDSFIIDIYPDASAKGRLWLLPPGRRSPDHFAEYANTVLTFDWQDFYQNWEGELYFEWLRQQFQRIADIVLVDSRTGVTEMGGVCTYQLADTVMMFCTANQQSLHGTQEMARNFQRPEVQRLRGGRPLNVLVIPARIERAESALLDKFQADFVESFEFSVRQTEAIGIETLWQLGIPYIPKYAFTEALAVRESSRASAEDIAKAFRRLSRTMGHLAGLQMGAVERDVEVDWDLAEEPSTASYVPLGEQMWQSIYSAFDPWERLWGEKLDTVFVEREHSPLRFLMALFRPDRDVQKALLVGHRGSGKSSELLKLVSAIAQDFFVTWFDAHLTLDILSANQVELLFLLGVAVYRVAEQEGLNPNRKNLDLLTDCLQTLIREQTRHTDLALPTIGAGVATLTTLAHELVGKTFSLGLRREEVARLEVGPCIREIARAVNLIIADVEQKARKPVLMVVDGLDRLEPDPARDIFINSRVLSLPNCRAVYVSPMALYYSADFAQIRQKSVVIEFPNVTLHERGDIATPYEEGERTMQKVVLVRLKASGYEPETIISPSALSLLVKMSGGLMREMINLMREAIIRAEIAGETRITLRAARAAVYKLRRQYAAGLRREHYSALETFLATGLPSRSEAGDELLHNQYILTYINDDIWYDVHPNVRPLLESISQ